jgi:hypothetical protein
MRTASIALIAMLAGTITLPAQSPIRPGQWEVMMQMDMPNMPVKMPEMKTTQCVTPEQANDPANSLPRPQSNGKQDCKVSNYKVSGKTVTWDMACTTPMQLTSTGEMTFTDDTYTGTVKINAPQGNMSMKISGTRLGDCTK